MFRVVKIRNPGENKLHIYYACINHIKLISSTPQKKY
jgi:hypothetical protein